jgi:hypothetical protein
MKGNEISAKALNESAKNYLQKQLPPFHKIHLSSFMYSVADYNPDNKKQGEE